MPAHDSMAPNRLRLAAVHLRATARTLRDSCTVAGVWADDHQAAQRDHDEMVALAAELDGHADDEDDLIRMAAAPVLPRTKEQTARDAAMFRGLSERLEREASGMPTGAPS